MRKLNNGGLNKNKALLNERNVSKNEERNP